MHVATVAIATLSVLEYTYICMSLQLNLSGPHFNIKIIAIYRLTS